MNSQKRKAISRANQSLIKCQRKRLETWLDAQEPSSKGEASATQALLTAVDQPLRIEAEGDVEMTEDESGDPVHDTPDSNTKSAEDMEVV